MDVLSNQLLGFKGGNPFRESQARTYGTEKIASEFYPTTFYWSLFNEQHEILLGTRGSGKTVLLQMLKYSCLRELKNKAAINIIENKTFIGFYVPFHLEFIQSMPGKKEPEDVRIKYFNFAVNCSTAKSLLNQLKILICDLSSDQEEKIFLEKKIVTHIKPMWAFDRDKLSSIKTIEDLEWNLDLLFNSMWSLSSNELEKKGLFTKSVFVPIVNILNRLTKDLNLNTEKTNWILCLDEAEYLSEPFIKSINTFLRSEKRPLVVKMATLPFRHLTTETLVKNVCIEANGNDFNYRIIDSHWDSNDFIFLCDHLCKVRLKKCGLKDSDITLARFLGSVGKDDDLIDYFRKELPKEATRKKILEGIRESFSDKRKDHYDNLPVDSVGLEKPILNKFSPVYFMRRMKEEESKGGRVVGWFAGEKTIRKISDGNPRRFIQIMDKLVEKARDVKLTSKNQHRVLKEFCQDTHKSSEALPRYGPVVKVLIDRIGALLSDRIHGEYMLNGGCNFKIEQDLLNDSLIISAIELAIGYSRINVKKKTLFHSIDSNTDFWLSYMYGVVFWLPMRKGDYFILRSKHRPLYDPENPPATPDHAKSVLEQFELEIKVEE